jgi:hypothetical protein
MQAAAKAPNGMRSKGVGAPTQINLTPQNGQPTTIANADAGSLLVLSFPNLDISRGITFSATGGVSQEIGPNIAQVSSGTNYTGILSQPLQLILDGNPGTLSVTWWVPQPNQFIPLEQSTTITIPGSSQPTQPQLPHLPRLPYPRIPLPGHPAPAPPAGVPNAPAGLPGPAPAAGTSGTTIALIAGGLAVVAVGGYLVYRHSKNRPARRSR